MDPAVQRYEVVMGGTNGQLPENFLSVVPDLFRFTLPGRAESIAHLFGGIVAAIGWCVSESLTVSPIGAPRRGGRKPPL